jgi:hypothetical protein
MRRWRHFLFLYAFDKSLIDSDLFHGFMSGETTLWKFLWLAPHIHVSCG